MKYEFEIAEKRNTKITKLKQRNNLLFLWVTKGHHKQAILEKPKARGQCRASENKK